MGRMERSILLVRSGGEAALPDWQRCFADAAPNLEVRWWDDPDVPPERVRYALVWAPEPARLAALPRLRLILSSGAGVEHITRDPDLPRGVPILRNAAPEAAQRMGEYVCLAALSLLRDAPRIARSQAERRWDSFDPERCAWEVRAGVLGLGRMGTRAAAMLAGLGFPVAGWSRSPKQVPGVESFAGEASFAEFLARTDLLVCLLPETPQTRGLLDATAFARLPRGAWVVNAGRGSQLVLPDLIAALDAGHLAGAALDVFEEEPLPAGDPAWAHPKIIVTSHLAAQASRRARARYFAEAIARFERGERLEELYDAARGY